MLTVFVQYYVPKTPERARELDECFKKNIENPHINELRIYFENEADMARIPDRPNIIKSFYPDRMTYGYWLRETDRLLPPGTLSFLINSDMYLTESIKHLLDHRQKIVDDKRFVAISRYNPTVDPVNPKPDAVKVEGAPEFVLNKDPHWTQDIWGVAKQADKFPSALYQEAAFELGQPGCDNKIAYVMHSYGFTVTNPCHAVKTIHLQVDDNTRSYNPKESKLIGLHAFVHPVKSVTEDSILDFDLLTRSKHDIVDIHFNNWINGRRSFRLKVDDPAAAPKPASTTPPAAPAAPANKPAENKPAAPAAPAVAKPPVVEKLIPRNEFVPAKFREIMKFTNNLVVYDDTGAYYFYDKFWPFVRQVPKAQINPAHVNDKSFTFFATGYLPLNFSDGVAEISDEMQYPEDVLFWQYPCRTEAYAFETHKRFKGPRIQGNVAEIYVALPWATFIDKKTFPEAILGLYASRIKTAKQIAEKLGYSIRVHTICQHIRWREIQTHLESLGITNLWISHKEVGLDKLGQIDLHPWSLYAVNYMDEKRNKGLVVKPPAEKPLVGSFIGAHMKHYLSEVRLGLKCLSDKPGFLVQIKDLWHFNKVVYNFQAAGNFDFKDATVKDDAEEYNKTLSDSMFSLCPVGAGPNSLRLWESLAIGSIPVNLSDRLQYPSLEIHAPQIKLKWEDAIVFHPENQVEGLEARLRAYKPEQIASMQKAGMEIFNALKEMTILGKAA
jgi:hypothetical protein